MGLHVYEMAPGARNTGTDRMYEKAVCSSSSWLGHGVDMARSCGTMTFPRVCGSCEYAPHRLRSCQVVSALSCIVACSIHHSPLSQIIKRDMSLQGKVAVVFGAGGHVGSAISHSLASHGATVFLLGLTLSKLEAVSESINGDRGAAHAVQVDAIDAAAVSSAIQDILSHPLSSGRIDIAINAVQLQPKQGTPLLDMAVPDVLHPIDRAVRLSLNIAQAVVPCMTSQFRVGVPAGGAGVLVLLSSTAAKLSGRDRVKHSTGGFSAACAVVEQLTYNLAAEVGRKGVRVVCVRPDALPETWGKSIVFGSPQAEMRDYMARGNMLGSNPTLSQVGETVAFLSGPGAGGMTGTVMDVNCGSVTG